MFQSLLSQDNINHLNVNSDISIPLEVKGFQGLKLQNITPFYFNVTDSNGVVILYIEPWQKIEEEIPLDKITYTFNSMCNSRPQVQNNSAPSSTWAIIYELTMTPLDSKSEAITISNASNVNINGTVGVNLEGTNSVNIGTLPTVDLNNQTQVGINNAVQTLTLVELGSTDINVSELANGASVTAMIAGLATGYFKTLILEGTSKNGYTYTATASAFNRSSNVGTPTLTQSNGTNGEFYASGSLANDQAFSNVQVSLQANVSSPSTIFQVPITSLTNWKVDSGSATAGASGTTFGANGTVIEETSQTGLVPQNLTLQGQFAVQNTQVTNNANSNVGQGNTTSTATISQSTTVGGSPSYTYGTSFSFPMNVSLTNLSIWTNGTTPVTICIWDSNGNLLDSAQVTAISGGFVEATFSNPIAITASTTYWYGVECNSSNGCTFGSNNMTNVTGVDNTKITLGNNIYYKASNGFPNTGVDVGNVSLSAVFYYSYISTMPLNGCRPLALSNGWLISSSYDNASQYVRFYVSKDNGQTWNILCHWNGFASNSTFAIASNGTVVYGIANEGNSELWCISFDATTVTMGAVLGSTGNTGSSSGITQLGTGCGLWVDSNGNMFAVFPAKTSAYPSCNNLIYAYSSNQGSTWSITILTALNTSGQYIQNPQIIMYKSNPYVVFEYNAGDNQIVSIFYNGSSWSALINIYDGTTNHQTNPTICVDGNNKLHVGWTGTDATYTTPQLKYSNSADGISWTSVQTLTNNNGSNISSPSITIDISNKVYIPYIFNSHDVNMFSSPDGTNWTYQNLSTIFNNDTCTSIASMYPNANNLNFSTPLVNVTDGTAIENRFYGVWAVGSHSTVSTHYRQDANDYYKVEWNAGNLNLIKVSGGTASTLASSTVNETATNVTLSLVVASNGNLTATLKGASTTQITATDTSITSGVLALGGDQNVVASNAFISGNYVPSDVVTVKAYAVA